MDKTKLSVYFFLMATILYATRFISASIGLTTSKVWSEDEFVSYLSDIPDSLMFVTLTTLGIGLILFGWGVIENIKNK
ncbi:hypothetical protein [Lentibacillus saliphilus]|uniref:hypothetical protein n=1 Tax=Lentibacillus saliphilus TaxID=2737028 RepID=UPI001C2F29D9|nr:hypothetical protein [Lentibacillus saliphilus]